MRTTKAAAGSLVFLVLVPGVVAGLVPWWLTGWQVQGSFAWPPVRVGGAVLAAAGVVVLLHAFVSFVVEGLGTPAPVAPTDRLVVGGLYRYVRNPMYVAVAAIIVGQALILGQPILIVYAAVFAVTVASFVHWYEEPTLRRQFGEQYETYRRAVPRWWPRREPWEAPPARGAVTTNDPHDLERFASAQDAGGTYASAVAELRAGRKVGHWMWFVFPQLAGLGLSAMSRRYAISSLEEARRYLGHPVLGPRLEECARILVGLDAGSAQDVFGTVDAMKLRSSMTLFARAAPERALFRDVLDRYFDGLADEATDARLATLPGRPG
ncbi:MAG TPA: DUF1810 family protein [Solirubrobacteraceae bacterium]|nr:DUF1810 family protein [Solirubrobacteraceae bacterium]